MSGGRRVSLDDLFKQKSAELRAHAESPQGIAQREANNARFLREEAARLRWEADNRVSPFDAGAEAADQGEAREAPEGLSESDEERWLAGYDMAGPDGND